MPSRKMVATSYTTSITNSKGAPSSGELLELVNTVQKKLDASDNPTKDEIEAYADLLKAVAEVQKTLPTTTNTTFSLPLPELAILAVYIIAGVALMVAVNFLIPGASWKADNLVTVFLYWTVVVGILLGANGLSSLLGGGSKDSSSKTSGTSS
jgi:hypothetical protein